ncbi:dihydroxyacetone kinase subunit DhaK [Ruminiclostridium cellobioparum]|uniref:dihydroxyacetone kinase subunit DhaK n=1 Tax=Ruminiclostridium cellobioparum TaxID=29355 RepID=UPI0028AA2709|nr:dihydroxyacetone kinase subunit DhaK [Ruminiclostridium cellobioparum]
MKKILNHADNFVEDSLKGILLAYPELLAAHPEDIKAVHRAGAPIQEKVAIVTGGGYGHIPVFLGYVGKGLCDGVAVGNVFTSPGCETILNVTRQVNANKGVLYLFGNYMGDCMNFEMAAEIAEMEGIKTETVKVSDDIASAPRESWKERRGIAGIFFAYKIAGACAERLAALEEVKAIAEKTIENAATFGVALSSCWLPGSEKKIFEIGEDDMEIGMGIHGEPGVKRGRLTSSCEITEILLPSILEDLSIKEGQRVAILVNGLGATSQEELFILYKDINEALAARGIEPVRVFVGEYATSLEMVGASISILKLDDELLELLDAPAYTPFVNVGGVRGA